jgi:hypothetical protein
MATLFIASVGTLLLTTRRPPSSPPPPVKKEPEHNNNSDDDGDDDDTLATMMRRNDSEYSLGLNRSGSVAHTLNELGHPCFYSWPETVRQLLWDNVAFIGAGLAVVAVAVYTEAHGGGHARSRDGSIVTTTT